MVKKIQLKFALKLHFLWGILHIKIYTEFSHALKDLENNKTLQILVVGPKYQVSR